MGSQEWLDEDETYEMVTESQPGGVEYLLDIVNRVWFHWLKVQSNTNRSNMDSSKARIPRTH